MDNKLLVCRNWPWRRGHAATYASGFSVEMTLLRPYDRQEHEMIQLLKGWTL